jgi:glutamine synthetase
MVEIANPAGVGRPGFVADHALYTSEQHDAVKEVIARIEELGLRTIRVIVVDQHGVPRAKFLSPQAAIAAFRNGVDFSGAIYSLDTANQVFPPVFAEGGGFGIAEFTGFPDVVIVPDPHTFQVLPWADRTGWILCDAYFNSGAPLPLDGRRILRNQLDRLGERGLSYLSGLEVEFYVTRRRTSRIELDQTGKPPAPPEVDIFEHGYQFLSEVRLDGVLDTLNALRDGLAGIGLLPRSMEDEWGPGQLEFSFGPMPGLGTADSMILFRSAVKQICQRQGLLATFMCKPPLPNFGSSGWHLHSSLVDQDGNNSYTDAQEVLSPLGLNYVAGLLAHAPAMTLFANPTINGYERFAPYTFAPDRICWAVDNRGALVRVQGGPGDPGTHLENRLGEPAANPYLYLAADIAAGLDGIEQDLKPPAAVGADPYSADAPALPATMDEAIKSLEADPIFARAFGDGFVNYYLMMKRGEVTRYRDAVTSAAGSADPVSAANDWTMREYFEFF